MRTSPLYLVLDLETIADPEFPDESKTSKGNDRFPPPPCHQILCAGYAFLRDHRIVDFDVLTGSPNSSADQAEHDILTTLTHTLSTQNPTLVGMNTRGFDAPVIAARCLRHGIPHPWYYATKAPRYRYGQTHHLDLIDYLCDHGAAPKSSLDVWARLIGWPGKGEESGANIPEMLEKGGLQLVAHYCATDVIQTTALLLRTDLLRGVLSPAAYYEAARDLLETAEGDIRTAGLVGKMRPEQRERFLLDPFERRMAAE